MEESKVGLVPRAIVQGTLYGSRECGILLTDKRIIFVPTDGGYDDSIILGGIIGGVIGAAALKAVSDKVQIDFINSSPDELARIKHSMSIPHTCIQSISIIKKMNGYWLNMSYISPNRKERKVRAQLIVPGTLMKRKLAEGADKMSIHREYASKACQIIECALPPSIAQRLVRSI